MESQSKTQAFLFYDEWERKYDSLEERNAANHAIKIAEAPNVLNNAFLWCDWRGCYHETKEGAERSNQILSRGEEQPQRIKEVSRRELEEIKSQDIVLNTKFSNEEFKNFELKLIDFEIEYPEKNTRKKGTVNFTFEVESQFGSGTVNVNQDSIGGMQWVQEVVHGLAIFTPTPEFPSFPKYIQAVVARDLPTIKKGKVFPKGGWIDDANKFQYVTNCGIIGDNCSKVRCKDELQWQSDYRIVGTRECAEEYLQMQKVYYNPDISRGLMLFVVMGMLTTIYEKAGFAIRFILALIGSTNSYKTSSALAFTTIYDAMYRTKAENSFLSTPGGIEVAVSKCDDCVVVFDDFRPSADSTEEKKMREKLELLCRLVGDGVEKKRMTDFCSNAGNGEYPLRCAVMITGELIGGIHSSMARTVVLNTGKDAVNLLWLSYFQDRPLVLPSFFEGFLAWFSNDSYEKVQMMRTRMQGYRKEAGFNLPRFNENYAQFMVAIDLLFEYLEMLGIRTENKSEWQQSVVRILACNDASLQTDNFAKIVLKALYHAMKTKKCLKHIEDIEASTCNTIYFDEDFIYIQADFYVKIAEEYTKETGMYSSINKRRLISTLKEEKILDIIIHSDGKEEAARKLRQGKGVVDRFLYIKRKQFMEIMGE